MSSDRLSQFATYRAVVIVHLAQFRSVIKQQNIILLMKGLIKGGSDSVTQPLLDSLVVLEIPTEGTPMREAVVAVFDNAARADVAVQALQSHNIPTSDIRRYHHDVAATEPPREERHGFWAWLLGEEGGTSDWRDPTYDNRYDALYADRIAAGNHVVAVNVDHTESQRVMDILATQNPLSLEEEQQSAGTIPTGTPRPAGTVNLSMGEGKTEEVIPLAEEHVEVGKRQVEQPVRVRRYVVERPVEETVHLRDERVEVERRRPVAGATPAGAFEERVVETREVREEPVVTRQAQVAEEVVVRHEATEHAETVRDTARKEEVEVDRTAERNAGRSGKRK